MRRAQHNSAKHHTRCCSGGHYPEAVKTQEGVPCTSMHMGSWPAAIAGVHIIPFTKKTNMAAVPAISGRTRGEVEVQQVVKIGHAAMLPRRGHAVQPAPLGPE